jgi:lysine 2,3-aminomutase
MKKQDSKGETETRLRSVADLVGAGLVADAQAARIERVGQAFAVGLTDTVQSLIDRDDPNDPIARQFIPDPAELEFQPEELTDPIGDHAFSPVEGIVHRYPDRVLLKILHVCAVYCRFCFRREMVGPSAASQLSPEALEAAFSYIDANRQIWEVILTGGDPMVMSLRRLEQVFLRLGSMNHVKIIRIHTRVPCVEPSRITPRLVDLLRGTGKTVFVALHANHPRELTAEARAACGLMIDAGIPMVSQTVLLRGVNDNVETLAALMRVLVETRIQPYYLHHPDLARGTAHFRLTIEEGQALVRALQGSLSGLCQPRYVLDIPGGYGKAPIGPSYIAGQEGAYRIADYQGRMHSYPPKPTGG